MRPSGSASSRSPPTRIGHRRLQVGPRPLQPQDRRGRSPSSRPTGQAEQPHQRRACGAGRRDLFRHHGRRGEDRIGRLLALGRQGADPVPFRHRRHQRAGLQPRRAPSLRHRYDEADGLRPRCRGRPDRRAAPLRPVRAGLGPSGRHGGRRGGLCLGLPLGRLAHHPLRTGRIGRARRARPDRAGHEMRLRWAGSDHALHHHRRYRPRPASRSRWRGISSRSRPAASAA